MTYDKMITLRVSKREHSKLAKVAKDKGMSLSQFVRHIVKQELNNAKTNEDAGTVS